MWQKHCEKLNTDDYNKCKNMKPSLQLNATKKFPS